jgi:hypothetical protein
MRHFGFATLAFHAVFSAVREQDALATAARCRRYPSSTVAA